VPTAPANDIISVEAVSGTCCLPWNVTVEMVHVSCPRILAVPES
jgi:hypothetical protein